MTCKRDLDIAHHVGFFLLVALQIPAVLQVGKLAFWSRRHVASWGLGVDLKGRGKGEAAKAFLQPVSVNTTRMHCTAE